MASDPTVLARTILPELFVTDPSKSQRTRVTIIEAAITVYGRDGIEAATQERIAAEAGISRPLIIRYFPKEDELFTLAMKYIRGNLQRMAVEAVAKVADGTVEDRLTAYVNSCFRWLRDYPVHARAWLAFLCGAGVNPRHRKENTELAEMGFQRIQAMLEAMPVNRAAAPDDLRGRAKAIQALIAGSMLAAVTENSSVPVKQLEQACMRGCLLIARTRARPSA